MTDDGNSTIISSSAIRHSPSAICHLPSAIRHPPSPRLLNLSPTPVPAHLDRFRRIATALDARFRLPGLGIRVGYDALLGLIPGAGDIIGGVLSCYGLVAGFRLGAPAPVLLRMLGNIALDTAIGAIPILGDLFDVGWKGNLRNLALLDRWAENPVRTERRSVALIWGIGAAVVVLLGGIAYLMFKVIGALLPG
jgi:hypothetical protein